MKSIIKKTSAIISILLLIVIYSCSSVTTDDDENIDYTPTVITKNISNTTYISSTSGGEIWNNGGRNIISKGLVWSTFENPTIDLATKTNEGSGEREFISLISNLEQNTTYYVRAYAKNNQAIGYGNQITFRTVDTLIVNGNGVYDIDGNHYSSLIINNVEWMAKNLSVEKYRNGDIIPQVQNSTEWKNLTTGAWCYYGNNSTNGTFGKLYNWYAVTDTRGLAPQGWHIPSDFEWKNLQDYLISAGYNYDHSLINDYLGKAIASTSFQQGTASAGTGSPALIPQLNNRTGFNALPAGTRGSNGDYKWLNEYSSWWSSTSDSSGSNYAKHRDITGHLTFGLRGNGSSSKTSGYSIRCVKN